ncbi:MAG: hypothetical protein SF053_19970 [Bacteroidia bacterium]|nr:hypothetical protein [Bacteroidia bacterium]
MATSVKLLTAWMTIVLLSSFTGKNASEFIGTYGVPASDPSQITLTLNADNTFYYQDLSIPDKKVIVKGNWILQGKKVFLTDNSSGKPFHNVWTISENGHVAKSRKGLTFYRLCKIDG